MNGFEHKPSKERGKSPPKKIGEIVTNLMAQRGYAQLASQAELRKWWAEAAGKLEKFSRAKEVKRGTLHVIVANSVVMQELAFKKDEIIQLLNATKQDQPIKDIRYRVGSIQ